MKNTSRVWKIGDIIQVALPDGYRYLQYLGKDSARLDILRVLVDTWKSPVADAALLASSPTAFHILSLNRVLSDDSRFRKIGGSSVHCPLPDFRRRFAGGWIIVGPSGERFVPNPIDDATAALSIEEGVPADFIVERLATDWRPDMDRGAIPAHTRHREATGKGERETTFFLSLSSSDAKREAANRLRRMGYGVSDESDQRSLAASRRWMPGDTLDTMDAAEIEMCVLLRDLGIEISGRETSA